jgi:hypothetical protein
MNPLEVLKQEEKFFSGNAINIKSLSKVYGIRKAEMSKLLKCQRQQVNTIYSKTNYAPRSKDIQQKLHDMIKIYSILRVLLKSPVSDTEQQELEEKIFQWFRIPNPAFPEAMSPFELVANGKGNIVIHSLMDQLHGSPT